VCGRIVIVNVYLARHGAGDPVLLLLHGLGATGEVWSGLVASLADRWPGEVLVPDLPGHGRSAPLPRYSFGALAAALADALPAGRPVAVLGHSLGGVLGLTLASGWFGVDVTAVCGLGIKVRWSPEELAKAAELAARPAKVFGTREEAMERALRVAGLAGLVPSLDSGVVPVVGSDVMSAVAATAASAAGLVAEPAAGLMPEGWRLSLDQATFGVGAPDLAGLLAACRAPVVLAAGERDPMSPRSPLRELRPDAVELAGLGHNAHVEDPSALWPLVDRLANAQ
jgi:pimeloyl-ACP methyl ester carboxylesterase